MTKPLIGVFALQGNVREHVAMLQQVGAEVIPVRRPAELATVDGLVLPGGESTTMEKLARAFDLFEPLRKAIADGLPVFGTCAGMILLADEITGGTSDQQTLGGLDMTVRRNAFGRQVDSFEADLSFAAFDTPYHAVFIRAPWVERVGRDVEILATIDSQHAVAVRRDKLLATSFHPELTGDPRLHGYFTALVRDNLASA